MAVWPGETWRENRRFYDTGCALAGEPAYGQIRVSNELRKRGAGWQGPDRLD
jgi:hypothetical protein